MPKALRHNYPAWQDDPHGEDGNDSREVWFGAMRVVSPKRARVLRKRGVPLMPLHAVREVAGQQFGPRRYEPTTPNGRARYAWFECKDDAEQRKYRRGAACYNTHLDAMNGTRGRKHYLASRLIAQRVKHQHARMWQQRDWAAWKHQRVGRGLRPYQQAAIAELKYGQRHAANPQLDLYAKAYRAMFGVMPEPEVATGEALDALCKVHGMPAHWTNEQRRQYIQHGYVVEVGDTRNMTAAEVDELRRQHMSPPVHVYIPGVLQREGVPTHFEVCPTCLLVPVLCRCRGDALAG